MAKRLTRWIIGRFYVALCLAILAFAIVPLVAYADVADMASTELPTTEEILVSGEKLPDSSQTTTIELADAVQLDDTVHVGNTNQSSDALLSASMPSEKHNKQLIAFVDDVKTPDQSTPPRDVKKDKAAPILNASEYTPFIAFAIYDETTDTLSFHKQETVPALGSTFVGNDDVTRTVSKLYENIETTAYSSSKAPPWSSQAAGRVIFVDIVSPISTAKWFAGQSLITSLNLDAFDTSDATDMSMMFYNCSSLTSLDVSVLRTSNVTDMRGMFRGCSSVTSLDLRNFDTSNVTVMNSMFQDCSSAVVIDLSSFDISALTTTTGNMFSGCTSLTTIYVGEKWVPSEYVFKRGAQVFQGCMNLVGCLGSRIDPDDPQRYNSVYLQIDGGPNNKGYLSTHKKSFATVTVNGLEMNYVLCTDTVGPTPIVMDGGKLLKPGVDYVTEFTQRDEKNNARIVISGRGEYEGFVSKSFATLYVLDKQASATEIKWSKERVDEAIEQTAMNAPLILKSNSPVGDFLRFLLNGKVVGPEHYTVTEGSTLIEIKPEFLNSLKSGTYTFEIQSKNEIVAAEITIEGEDDSGDIDPETDLEYPEPAGSSGSSESQGQDSQGQDSQGQDSQGQGSQGVSGPTAADVASNGSGSESTTGSQSESVSSTKTYNFLSGVNATHELGSGKPLVLRADGELGDFVSVLIDDEELDSAHFTTKAGSTIVTIDPEYLDTLPEGDHKLALKFKDGEATTSFTVYRNSEDKGEPSAKAPVKTRAKRTASSRSETPDTGDGDMAALLFLMIACALGFCGIRKSTSL